MAHCAILSGEGCLFQKNNIGKYIIHALKSTNTPRSRSVGCIKRVTFDGFLLSSYDVYGFV
jgi:hypothetical protein